MEQKELHTHKLLYWHVAGFGSSLRWLDSKQQARDVPYATTCSYLFNKVLHCYQGAIVAVTQDK